YTHELTCSGECIHISPREAFLLKYLMANKNKVLKREDILKELWGKDDYYMGRSMDVFISRVRKHISSDKGVSIINIRGTGFILKEHNDSENS
ncbi:MAG: winged helix-turn-helix transcriptional regulator, partial [Bacteroidales bacterium]|nr:winged helix-turn-helix transcriptional regulator [Bacteroidales bacterium]